MSKKSDALLELAERHQLRGCANCAAPIHPFEPCACSTTDVIVAFEKRSDALARAVKAMVEESGRHIRFNGVPMLTDAYRSLVAVGHTAAFPEEK